MYPHFTELQKNTNYFNSLLCGDALQACCSLEDSRKDSMDEIMTIFKRCFGDYVSMAKARCEWEALNFGPTTQKLHEFLDIFQTTAKKAIGAEAQQPVETKPTEERSQNPKKGYCFYCNKFGYFKADCRKMKKDKWH